jgi:hypothetical protein
MPRSPDADDWHFIFTCNRPEIFSFGTSMAENPTGFVQWVAQNETTDIFE